ncbi:MAG: hypothetical protein WAX79_05835 [Candidatus Omnitrophota bacterium]
MNIISHRTFLVSAISFIFLSLIVVHCIAQTDPELLYLKGWAWSSNIGWVDLNEVSIDPSSGNLNGYGWSSNIGWIDFSPAAVDLTTGKLIGWARACSVFASGCAGVLEDNLSRGDWDGLIKMSGQADNGDEYGVRANNLQISGFAWGDLVVGWLSFDALIDVSSNANWQTCSLSANPSRVIPFQSTNLSWRAENSANCRIDSGIGTVCDNQASCEQGGAVTVKPAATATYILTCRNNIFAWVFCNAAATVEVGAAPKIKEIRPQ